MTDKKYFLTISLSILNHLGLNLYSNNSAVLSEIVANAWDADAEEVRINFSEEDGGTITITDDGFGMDDEDVRERYLRVGYEKRGKKGEPFITPNGRKPMGRKGIGKLSVFSIADKVSVYTKKEKKDGEAFMLDAKEIKKHIEDEDQKDNPYLVPPLEFNNEIKQCGTVIKITQFKRKLTKNTFDGLKKRIARRFSIIGEENNFNVFLSDEKITYADREYFHKARFLFQYQKDFSKYCNKLDKGDAGEKLYFSREYKFNKNGEIDESGQYSVSGWIAIAHHSDDLDGDESKDDNLNNITLVVRGKVAQEDLLHERRLGGMITKYMYGEIQADFLDTDQEEDIATSSRQKIIEDDPRYQSLKEFIGNELNHIWGKTNKLKDDKGMKKAIELVPVLNDWYEGLGHKSLKDKAKKIFGIIDKSNVEKKLKKELYAYGVLAFERDKLAVSSKILDNLNEDNVKQMLSFFRYVDDMEATLYREIVNQRLTVIKKLQDKTWENVFESDLRDYLFNHLWLFDPAWERSTENEEMEKTMQSLVDGEFKTVRLDIKYRKPQREHVIIELKRANRTLSKLDIEEQLHKYIKAVKKHLIVQKDDLPVSGICIVGKLPKGWDNPEYKKEEEASLKSLGIRVMTYNELIKDAHSAYSKFLGARATANKLTELIEKIRNRKEG